MTVQPSSAGSDWPPKFEMMKLEAQAPNGEWIPIFPAQLGWMAKDGRPVRAIESTAIAQCSPQPVCDLCDAPLMCAACGHEQRPAHAKAAPEPKQATMAFPKWWVEKCRDQLLSFDPMPSGPLGDWAFLFRAILVDAVEMERAAPQPASNANSSQQSRLAERLTDVIAMLDTPDAYNRGYIAAVCRSILSSVSSTSRVAPIGPWAEGCPNYPGCKCDDVCIDWGGSPLPSTHQKTGGA